MRGQVQQVFIYILVIIVVGLIMLMGYNAMSDFINKGEDIKLVNLQTDLENFAERHTSYGTVKIEELTVPSGINEICFLNNSANPENIENTIIKQYASSGIEPMNVFLIGDETTPFLKLDLVYPKEPVTCITAQSGKFFIKFEGQGSKVLVSEK